MTEILQNIIDEYKKFDETVSIGIGGSSASNYSDNESDIDIYIFIEKDIDIKKRNKLVKKYSTKYETGCEYFGSGDEFLVDKLNKQLDIMYFNKDWFEDIFNSVWIKHTPSNGYTTCFLYTLSVLDIAYDKNNWLNNLKNALNTQYPKELEENIIKRNLALIKDKPFASYYEQINKAVKRDDLNSVNHRVSAFLASYFDIIFAKNKLLHPGEKRLVQYAIQNCKILPEDFEKNINNLILSNITQKIKTLDDMIEKLRKIIV